jgi:Proline racemase
VSAIRAVDYHTGGEPFRIVTGGVEPPHGATILDRRRDALEKGSAFTGRRGRRARRSLRALYAAVCELGFEAVVAKNHSSLYRPNDRGWLGEGQESELLGAEREAMARKHERRVREDGRGNGKRLPRPSRVG